MGNFSLNADEVVLYENYVLCSGIKGSVYFTFTSQKMVFEKEKGVFKKEKELIDIILLENVKVYNDAAQVKQKGSDVEVQTVDKNITLTFDNMFEARKFAGKMVDTITGTTLAKRGSNKIKDAFNMVDDTLGLDTRETIKGVLENGIKGAIFNGIKKK